MSDTATTTKPIQAAVQSGDSSISDLSYRNYDGPLSAGFLRWWVIMRASLRLTWSRWWFFILAGLPLLRFLGAGFWVYLGSFSARTLQAGPTGNFLGEPDGQKYALHFWSALSGEMNSMMALIIVLVAGAGCIASDNRSNALLVYFSKPISKLDYLFGKWMAIFATVAAIYLAPAALLFGFCAISFRDDGFLTSEPWLGPRLLLAVLVPAFIHSSLVVGISAWSKSARIVGAIYASIYILGGTLSVIIANILYKDRPDMKNIVQHCSLSGIIGGITQNIMHVVVPAPFYFSRPFQEPSVTPMPTLWVLLTVAAALVCGSLFAAWIKIRAVEVVRS